jgi:regulator of protease activity HflC (stomatin/prohibitin superfamily)
MMDQIILGLLGFLVILVIVTIKLSIKIVPQGEEWVVERLGKYSSTLIPGLRIIVPYLDKVIAKVTTKDVILDTPRQEVITKDNAVIMINAVAFIKVTNPRNAVYGIEDFTLAIQNLIVTTLRSIIGDMDLDESLSSREEIKASLKEHIVDDVMDWGITVKSVDIQDITPSDSMQQAMEKQAAAERERKAVEAEAEGAKNAMILHAEGKLEAAKREAEAQVALSKASAMAIRNIKDAIAGDETAPMFLLGDRYVSALDKMTESENSKFVVYPADIQNTLKGMFSINLK